MGGFYTAYFSTHWAAFVGRLKSRVMEQMAQLFPYFRNSQTSFFNALANNNTAFQALGIHLKPQVV
jgi:hypothetical protein